MAFLVFSLPSRSPRYKQYQLLVFTNISETLVSPVTPMGSITDDGGLCGSWAVWIVGCAETGQLEMLRVYCSSQQRSVAFSETGAEEQRMGSQEPKKINSIFLSFLAYPELSVSLKQQAGRKQ